MVTNTGPRPYVPGCPVQLEGLSTDTMPTEWMGKPIANGSTFKVIDKDTKYKFDQENQKWYTWTQDGGGGGSSSSGGSDKTGNVAPDDDVDEALDTLYPTPGGIEGSDEPPSGKYASDDGVNEALDNLFNP